MIDYEKIKISVEDESGMMNEECGMTKNYDSSSVSYNSGFRTQNSVAPFPLYVLIAVGLSLTGFFPFMMVCYALFRKGKISIALSIFFINLLIFLLFTWALIKIRAAWWILVSIAWLFNLIWSICAWIFQRRFIGTPPPPKGGNEGGRYIIREWKSWISPILIGMLIGICMTTMFSIPTAVKNRVEMRKTIDILDRETVLKDFFHYKFVGISASLILGFWWARERKRFGTNHVITFLSAFVLTFASLIVYGFLLLFLIYGGQTSNFVTFLSSWTLIPPWTSGFKKLIIQMQDIDISALIVIPLLFGSASRIRDFGKSAVIIIPLSFFCMFPMLFIDGKWWLCIQRQIAYEMYSPKKEKQDTACEWAYTLLKRYPDHSNWPELAENLAKYFYQEGRYNESKLLYEEIYSRFKSEKQWYWITEHARAILDSKFVQHAGEQKNTRLKIPMVDYEKYITHNWMSLLSVIRYWEGAELPESEVKIRLKEISGSSDIISLMPLNTLADLHEAAKSLNYEVLIMSAEPDKVKSLIYAGFPVIHHCQDAFDLVFGIDESRSLFQAYSFHKLSLRLRKEARKEAGEILSIAEEGKGESKQRHERIANEVENEYTIDFWSSQHLKYLGPLMAVVLPADKLEACAVALNTDVDNLNKQSKGYLAALIGISFLKNADPVRAIEWAKIGTENISDPMPLYVLHAAKILWESRNHKINSSIRLQDQFPELKAVFDEFESHQAAFIHNKEEQFIQLPKIIIDEIIQVLDRSIPEELEYMLKLINESVRLNPADFTYWKSLADIYEWKGDIKEMVDALKGLVSCNPADYKAKLRLALGHIMLEQYPEAEIVLNKINAGSIRYDADYPFCAGAIAEWKKDTDTALKKYAQAVEMRRYRPIYHLRYGRLLLNKGRHKEAKIALEWAARIDADDKIKKEAEMLLAKIVNSNE